MTTNKTTSPASRPARPFTALLAKKESLIIDGAMSTALEALGADLKDDLWTAIMMRRIFGDGRTSLKNIFSWASSRSRTVSQETPRSRAISDVATSALTRY